MPSPRRTRLALLTSLLVIVLAWAASIWTHLFRPPGAPPGSVWAIAAYVVVKAAIVVAIVWTLLRAGGERLKDLGLSGPALGTACVLGPLIAAGLFALVNVALPGVLRSIGTPARPEALPALFRDVREVPVWVFVAVVGGGFTEEVARAFVLTRFGRALGRPGLVAAVVVDTFVFGLGHLYQGVTGAIQAGVSGLVFALVFLRRRRVADSMVVHAIYDLIGIAVAYVLYGAKR